MAARGRSLLLIVLAQVLALSVWFSGAASLPGLIAAGDLPPLRQAALTSAVQAGFVLGAIASAVLGLPDRFNARRVFCAGAIVAALANILALACPPGGLAMIATRFCAGAALALVYPVGMKLATSWARGDSGFLVGLLVGALTLGSALPFVFSADGPGVTWQAPFAISAVAALGAAALILGAGDGPGLRPAPPFRPGAVLLAFRDPALRLANLGYLGHMWELYAMWAWIGPFALAYWSTHEAGGQAAAMTAFAVIAIGAPASLIAGHLADRISRTAITIGAMAISGSCAILAGLAFEAPAIVVVPLLLVWGMAVIADSAQFSAAVAELSPPELTGTLLTLQTALGFALTAVVVQVLPIWIGFAGWQWGFAPLAIGPFMGVVAMARLRARPEAARLAGGRR